MQRVPCPLVSPRLGYPVFSLSLETSDWHILTHHSLWRVLCDSPLTHLAEYTLPFAPHCHDVIRYLPIRWEFLEGSLSLNPQHWRRA